MSFLYINDPVKRITIVSDYLQSLKGTNHKATIENDGKELLQTTKDENKEISLTIQFLPGDIKSLQTKLSYLIGEYRAGNTSATRNQIIAIADNLFQRNHLSKEQYSHIIHTL